MYPESARVTGGEQGSQGVEDRFLIGGNGSKWFSSGISRGSSEFWEQVSSVRQKFKFIKRKRLRNKAVLQSWNVFMNSSLFFSRFSIEGNEISVKFVSNESLLPKTGLVFPGIFSSRGYFIFSFDMSSSCATRTSTLIFFLILVLALIGN